MQTTVIFADTLFKAANNNGFKGQTQGTVVLALFTLGIGPCEHLDWIFAVKRAAHNRTLICGRKAIVVHRINASSFKSFVLRTNVPC